VDGAIKETPKCDMSSKIWVWLQLMEINTAFWNIWHTTLHIRIKQSHHKQK